MLSFLLFLKPFLLGVGILISCVTPLQAPGQIMIGWDGTHRSASAFEGATANAKAANCSMLLRWLLG